MRDSATMVGSLSPRCSVLNTASRFTSIRPAASLSAEAGFITSTARIRKNRQGNQGLTRRSLPFDYCLALLAAALNSSHFRSLEDRWESLKAEAYLQYRHSQNRYCSPVLYFHRSCTEKEILRPIPTECEFCSIRHNLTHGNRIPEFEKLNPQDVLFLYFCVCSISTTEVMLLCFSPWFLLKIPIRTFLPHNQN